MQGNATTEIDALAVRNREKYEPRVSRCFTRYPECLWVFVERLPAYVRIQLTPTRSEPALPCDHATPELRVGTMSSRCCPEELELVRDTAGERENRAERVFFIFGSQSL